MTSTGFPCPTCGVRTDVKDSRPHDGGIRRTRLCPSCDLRFHTMESTGEENAAQVNKLRLRLMSRLYKLGEAIDKIEQELGV